MVCGFGLANSSNEIEVENVSKSSEDVAIRDCCTRTAVGADGTAFSHTTCYVHINEDPCRLAQAAANLKARMHDLKVDDGEQPVS